MHSIYGIRVIKEYQSTQRKSCPIVNFSAINPTQTEIWLNLGLCDQRLVTCLNYSMALEFMKPRGIPVHCFFLNWWVSVGFVWLSPLIGCAHVLRDTSVNWTQALEIISVHWIQKIHVIQYQSFSWFVKLWLCHW